VSDRRRFRALSGVRGRVVFTVLVVTACLYSLLGTVGFLYIANSGRDAIRERVGNVIDQLESELRNGTGTVSITSRCALLDQQVALLDPAQTIRENHLRLNPGDTENACRAALARFMFRADAALKRVGELSGGEMLRAGLAVTIGSSLPPELLILDEPTNHLDIHAIAAVEAGLRAYDGALLVVSHDRAFLGAIGITREVALG